MNTEDTRHTEEEATTKLDGDILLSEEWWDNRMRLLITKDFSKEKPMAGGLAAKDTLPVQRRFLCTTCQQMFVCASDCVSHIRTHSKDAQGMEHSRVQRDSFHKEMVERVHDCENDDVDTSDDNETFETVPVRREPSDGEKTVLSFTQETTTFPNTGDVSEHFTQNFAKTNTSRTYECKFCGKTFLDMKGFRNHCHREQPKETNYSCSVCHLSFSTKTSLTKHERRHTKPHQFKCNINDCARAFSDKASINRHQLTHSEQRPHVCPHCNKAFKLKNHLREHVRLHTGERPFVCEVCGLGFAQSNGLKSHAKQHSHERANQCDICHRAFSRPHILEMHQKVHFGEIPFSCHQCDQTFRTASNLGAHKKQKHGMANRNGEKQFTCDVCGVSFAQACNLGIHKKKKHSPMVFSDQKPFVCGICDARFSEACNLGAHKKMKHTEQSDGGRTVFACDVCGAKFYRESNLAGHKRRKHGGMGVLTMKDK